MDELQRLYFSAQSVLHLSCNPKKANSWANPNLSPKDLELKTKFCEDETVTLMKMYRTLEDQVRKAENPELDSWYPGPDKQILVAKIKNTKEALFTRVHTLIGMLSQHLVALTNTVDTVDPERNEVVHGRSADLKDSVETKIEMLQRQIKKWERRIYHIKKGAADSLSP